MCEALKVSGYYIYFADASGGQRSLLGNTTDDALALVMVAGSFQGLKTLGSLVCTSPPGQKGRIVRRDSQLLPGFKLGFTGHPFGMAQVHQIDLPPDQPTGPTGLSVLVHLGMRNQREKGRCKSYLDPPGSHTLSLLEQGSARRRRLSDLPVKKCLSVLSSSGEQLRPAFSIGP